MHWTPCLLVLCLLTQLSLQEDRRPLILRIKVGIDDAAGKALGEVNPLSIAVKDFQEVNQIFRQINIHIRVTDFEYKFDPMVASFDEYFDYLKTHLLEDKTHDYDLYHRWTGMTLAGTSTHRSVPRRACNEQSYSLIQLRDRAGVAVEPKSRRRMIVRSILQSFGMTELQDCSCDSSPRKCVTDPVDDLNSHSTDFPSCAISRMENAFRQGNCGQIDETMSQKYSFSICGNGLIEKRRLNIGTDEECDCPAFDSKCAMCCHTSSCKRKACSSQAMPPTPLTHEKPPAGEIKSTDGESKDGMSGTVIIVVSCLVVVVVVVVIVVGVCIMRRRRNNSKSLSKDATPSSSSPTPPSPLSNASTRRSVMSALSSTTGKKPQSKKKDKLSAPSSAVSPVRDDKIGATTEFFS